MLQDTGLQFKVHKLKINPKQPLLLRRIKFPKWTYSNQLVFSVWILVCMDADNDTQDAEYDLHFTHQ